MSITFINRATRGLVFLFAFLIPILVNAPIACAQDGNQNQSIASTKGAVSAKASGPKFTEYRGVSIGMTTDDVRQRLGKPKQQDKTQDLFVFSNSESAQIYYDEQQKVYAISIDFSGKGNAAPTAIEILGQDITAKADGSIYQMQQYPAAGYWVSYNRSAGDSPVITVTMQRIPVPTN